MWPRKMEHRLKAAFSKFPVLAILGPRQSGKTTLAKKTFPHLNYANLEDLSVREYVKDDPKDFLEKNPEGLIIDEIQHIPELLSYLQVYVDKADKAGMYVITGSHQILLSEKISQSLAGRVLVNILLPLSYTELKQKEAFTEVNDLLFGGFYPRLHQYDIKPRDFYPSYIQTYIEKDIRQLINISDLSLFQKFLKLCAGRVGQLLNLTSLANDCGISHVTARKWLSLLEMSFVVYLLKPYYQNFNKRLSKSPKLYFYDTGLLCSLLGIDSCVQLDTHFARGALFENFILLEYLKKQYNRGTQLNCYFWRDKMGHEIDLLVENNQRCSPIEIKSGKTISRNYFNNIKYFDKVSQMTHHSYLVYNGEKSARGSTTILSWQDLDTLWNDTDTETST